jgi:asparagine synthase (glutamine-hydrolysing)
MCGIAGLFHFREPGRPVDAGLLDAMTASLAHRGPDGQGLWTAPGIGLGHRRLAIIDTSDAGRQPMSDATGELWITYNGEIYNFAELRVELASLGYPSRTRTDTEVILLGYRAWGPAVVERLSGIFAFALWDARNGELFLARDHLGVKPLFYATTGGVLRFGSEIKAILTDPAVPRDVDPEALDAFLTLGYAPAPATGYAAVRQLLPGECAIVDRHGLTTRTYWTVPYAERPADISFPEAVERFSALIDQVTAAQMVADVPLGAFLSGGLDSAAIVRAMTRAGQGRVTALSVGFEEASFDERPRAGRVAAALGVEWIQDVVRADAVDLLPRLSQHMEEPTADSSMLPVFLLCQAARRRFTVAMSGDGADETLAGYETYRATALARYYRLIPGALRRGVLAPLAHRLPAGDGKYSAHQVATRFTAGAEQGAGRDHASWRIMLGAGLKRRLYAPEFGRRVAHCDPVGAYAAHIGSVPAGREPLAGLLHADTAFYLPNDMLVKVDRMSMANSLEVRVPFLDPAMVTFAASLPPDHKLHRGRVRKHVLRESLRGSLPADVLRAPKSGFNLPVEAWMRGSLRDLLFDAVGAQRNELGHYVRAGEIEALAEEHRARRADHGHALFTMLMLALWFENRDRAWRVPSRPLAGVAVP